MALDRELEHILRACGCLGYTQTDRNSGTTKFSDTLIDAIDFGPRSRSFFHIEDIIRKLHPEDVDLVRKGITRNLGRSNVGEFIYRAFDRQGKTRWLQYRFTAQSSNESAEKKVSGLMFDITAQIEEGQTYLRLPSIPENSALNHMSDGLMLAARSAQQANEADIEHYLRPALYRSGLLLADSVRKMVRSAAVDNMPKASRRRNLPKS